MKTLGLTPNAKEKVQERKEGEWEKERGMIGEGEEEREGKKKRRGFLVCGVTVSKTFSLILSHLVFNPQNTN